MFSIFRDLENIVFAYGYILGKSFWDQCFHAEIVGKLICLSETGALLDAFSS